MATSHNGGVIVYKAVSRLTGGFYIGMTKATVHYRKKQHEADSRKVKPIKFSLAIKEYGIENFEFHELYKYDNRGDAGEMERLLIAELNPHYNVAPGGDGQSYWTGKKRSVETIEKIKNTKRINGTPPPTKKSLHALMTVAREKSRILLSKTIKCVNDGKLYPSCTAAAIAYGLKKSAVSYVACGKRNSAFGLRFKYV